MQPLNISRDETMLVMLLLDAKANRLEDKGEHSKSEQVRELWRKFADSINY